MGTIWQFEGYESVYIEDDHYLHACHEPFGWAHLLCVREFHPVEGKPGEYIIGEAAGADCEYLLKLDDAPKNIAREIIWIDTKMVVSGCDWMDEDEKESYLEYKFDQLDYWEKED